MPAVPAILKDLHGQPVYTTIIVSLWELGEGVGPLVIGPLADHYGRAPITQGGNILTVLCLAGIALSVSVPMLVAFRFLAALVNVTLTLAPAIVADLFVPKQRGAAMAATMFPKLLGPLVGPIVGGLITAHLGWRWTAWIVVIPTGLCAVGLLLFFRESHPGVLQQHALKNATMVEKTAQYNSATERIKPSQLKEHPVDESIAKTATELVAENAIPTVTGIAKEPSHVEVHQHEASSTPSATNSKESTDVILASGGRFQAALRPCYIAIFSPSALCLSLYSATATGSIYLVLTTLVGALQTFYHFDQSIVGLGFLPWAIGATVGLFLYGAMAGKYANHREKVAGEFVPEDRLPFAILGSFALPIGFLIYGWSAQYGVHWIVPLIGTAFMGLSLTTIQVPIQNYLTDAFEAWSASAVTVEVVPTAFFSAFFPFAGPPLYAHLGFGWGNSVLALICAVWIPILLFLARSGTKYRASPRLRSAGQST